MIKDTKSKRAPGSVTPTAPNDPHSISFVKGLVARGEAARADAKRNLPSGATHEIVCEERTSDRRTSALLSSLNYWAPDTMLL